MSLTENRIASPDVEWFACSCHAQLGTTNESCRFQASVLSPTTVLPSPRTTKYIALEVWRCFFVRSPGRSIWIQQPSVGNVEVPATGLTYSSATPSYGLPAPQACELSAASVSFQR